MDPREILHEGIDLEFVITKAIDQGKFIETYPDFGIGKRIILTILLNETTKDFIEFVVENIIPPSPRDAEAGFTEEDLKWNCNINVVKSRVNFFGIPYRFDGTSIPFSVFLNTYIRDNEPLRRKIAGVFGAMQKKARIDEEMLMTINMKWADRKGGIDKIYEIRLC